VYRHAAAVILPGRVSGRDNTSNGVGRDGATTHGGFSDVLVVNQDYVLRVPGNLR
jgi:D-arabinose 1-dehydrogenase-like Zn-dependent alcohol dehydrogenase